MGGIHQSLFSFLTEKMTKKKGKDKVIEIDGNDPVTNETPRNGPSSNGTSKYIHIHSMYLC